MPGAPDPAYYPLDSWCCASPPFDQAGRGALTLPAKKLGPEPGVVVDDYGHWQGCRRSVDEFIEEDRLAILLCRIDYTGRIAIKPGP